jgi:hypothetical protein
MIFNTMLLGGVNAVPIHCFERARARAIALEQQGHPPHKNSRGYLWGLPILVNLQPMMLVLI